MLPYKLYKNLNLAVPSLRCSFIQIIPNYCRKMYQKSLRLLMAVLSLLLI